MRAIATASLLSALALAQSASASACLKNGEPVKGRFELVDAKIPNGTTVHQAPFLLLDHTVCVESAFGYAKGTRMQLMLDRGRVKKLKPGVAITVVGNYGPPETWQHFGDVMAFDAVIVRPN